jgi:hypothetical protein
MVEEGEWTSGSSAGEPQFYSAWAADQLMKAWRGLFTRRMTARVHLSDGPDLIAEVEGRIEEGSEDAQWTAGDWYVTLPRERLREQWLGYSMVNADGCVVGVVVFDEPIELTDCFNETLEDLGEPDDGTRSIDLFAGTAAPLRMEVPRCLVDGRLAEIEPRD